MRFFHFRFVLLLFSDANQRVINLQLKELTDFGLIEKKIYAELPPHSEYSLIELGRSALPLLDELDAWGENLRPQMKKLFGEE